MGCYEDGAVDEGGDDFAPDAREGRGGGGGFGEEVEDGHHRVAGLDDEDEEGVGVGVELVVDNEDDGGE